ncbi:MAG: aldehyde dehydrogenase family protein [Betaproteobacteria bacterium]
MSTLEIFNPATGARIAQLQADTPASVVAKAQAARAAQAAWAATALADRKACIARFRASLVAEIDTLAALLTSEMGKPIGMARGEIQGLLGRIDFFLDAVDLATTTETVYAQDGMREQIEHVALGVVANISAWNYPWFVGGNVFVPALLTGNAVLYKPSEFATLTGLAIARLLHSAGVPQDVFTTLVGTGEVGAALLVQDIDGLFFTGSHATGAKIAHTLGPRMVKMQLELGGKDPTYVCEDAHVANAAASLADGAMFNTGQGCCSVERVYVHEAIYDAFVAAFTTTVTGFKMGDPTHEDTYIGAVTRAPQLAVLQAQVDDAVAKGARLECGGKQRSGPGNWFEPTVLSHVDHRMDVMREESFGPIVGIQKVANDQEAVALMNDTRYGLTAGVFTPNEQRARALLARVRAGTVYWNCCDRVSPRLPWSGYADSGMGLTLSTYGIATFTRPKAWHLRQG